MYTLSDMGSIASIIGLFPLFITLKKIIMIDKKSEIIFDQKITKATKENKAFKAGMNMTFDYTKTNEQLLAETLTMLDKLKNNKTKTYDKSGNKSIDYLTPNTIPKIKANILFIEKQYLLEKIKGSNLTSNDEKILLKKIENEIIELHKKTVYVD